MRFFYTISVAIFAIAAMGMRVQAASLQAHPENYRSVLSKLQPGDDLLLAPGNYRLGMSLHGLQGTAQQPITIRGPAAGPPAVFFARGGHNTISLSNTAHVQISNLILDGRNLDVDAIKAEGRKDCAYVHHIVLQDILIVGHGAEQSVIGISTKCLAWNWTIRRNVIVGAGTGLYLGNSDGNAQFFGGLIEQNLVLDTLGYNLQIKHQNERPAAKGMPVERTRTIIRHNLFSKAHHATSGPDARPNVLLGHFPRQGPGADDAHEVANNLFYCNPVEALLQAEGNLAITGNVLINPAGDAVSLFAHHDVPKAVKVDLNFIAAAGRGVTIVKASPSHAQTVSDNWLFSPAPLSGGNARNNQTAPYPASEPQLLQWLGAQNDVDHRAKVFAPLLTFAQQVCARTAKDLPPELTATYNLMSNHPACKLVELLAGAKTQAASPVDRVSGLCQP